jgi:dGTP triphosphohydrolase
MRANALNRGLTHMLVTSLIHHSRAQIRAWARKAGVESHEGYLEARPRLPAGLIGLTPAARALYDGLCDYVARHLHQGAWLSSVRARAAQLIAGLFRALTEDPRLAEDDLLLRHKEECGGRYLRDVPPREMDMEIRRHYRGHPRFARLVADHISGMTDLYLISEHERLVGPFQPGGARP